MNATSLFVSASRLVLQADVNNPASLNDLYRLMPYLRQSLSCSVCANLLIEPFSPVGYKCQHHVCRLCRGGRKILKPPCNWCKDYSKYTENIQLRILLQCYKKLCVYLISTAVFKRMVTTYAVHDTSSLAELIEEGATLKDHYESTAGLSKSALSILPCIYANNSSTTQNGIDCLEPPNAATSYEQKLKTNVTHSRQKNGVAKSFGKKKARSEKKTSKVNGFGVNASHINGHHKKSLQLSSMNKRKGCRCGNATVAPGKLTCCGQRCPCYVESKACTECKCRGCRNPHLSNGLKVHSIKTETEDYSYMTSSPIPPITFDESTLPSLDSSNPFPSVDATDLSDAQFLLFEIHPGQLQNSLFMQNESSLSDGCDYMNHYNIGIQV